MYRLHVAKANPVDYYSFDEVTHGLPTVGTIGDHAPLISGMKSSKFVPSGGSITIPFELHRAERGERPFSLSFVCCPYTTLFMGDIFKIQAATATFTVTLETGVVSVSAPVEASSRQFVAIVFSGDTIQLYLDGKLAASKAVEVQHPALVDKPTTLPLTGNFAIQGLATYARALVPEEVEAMWTALNRRTTPEAVASMYSGVELRPEVESMTRLTEDTFSVASHGIVTNKTIIGQEAIPNKDESGEYLPGTWEFSLELPEDKIIKGIHIEIEAIQSEGSNYTVSLKVDDGPWTYYLYKMATSLAAGESTNKTFTVKVETTGEIKLIAAHVSTFEDYTTTASRPVTIPPSGLPKDTDNRWMNMNDSVIMSGNVTIEIAGGEFVNALNMWVFPFMGSPVCSLDGQVYVNGLPVSLAEVPTSRWCMLTFTGPATEDPITLSFSGAAFVNTMSVLNLADVPNDIKKVFSASSGDPATVVNIGSLEVNSEINVSAVSSNWTVTKST